MDFGSQIEQFNKKVQHIVSIQTPAYVLLTKKTNFYSFSYFGLVSHLKSGLDKNLQTLNSKSANILNYKHGNNIYLEERVPFT